MKPKDPEKVQKIYKATLALVGQAGLAGLTMAAIGKEAGIGMGTLYTYFESKEALINSLFKLLKQDTISDMYSNLDPKEPYLLSLRRVFLNFMKVLLEKQDEHFFLEQCTNSHFLDEEAKAVDAAAFETFFQLLDAGKAQMLIKPIDNALIAAHLLGSSREIARLLALQPQNLHQQFIDDAFTLIWDSVKR
jgi:AcrR family transcriptional regulator